MKKERLKGFVSGILVSVLSFALIGGAMAAYQRNATLNYSGIKITMNGNAVTPTDANGKAIEPFAIDGTTYLPVRGIANALGLDVAWNSATQTVALSDKSSGQSSGTVIMEKNGIMVTFLGFAKKDSFLKGYDIKLKVENSNEKDYIVQVRNLSVNGVMSSGSSYSPTVAAGKVANDPIWVYNIDEDGIGEPIKTAEFRLRVIEAGNWSTFFDSEVITVK